MDAENIVLGTITQGVISQTQILDELFGEERKRSSIINENNSGVIYL